MKQVEPNSSLKSSLATDFYERIYSKMHIDAT